MFVTVSCLDKLSLICFFVFGIFRHVHLVSYRMHLVYRLRFCRPLQTNWFYSYRVFLFSFSRVWRIYHIETMPTTVQATKYAVYMETKNETLCVSEFAVYHLIFSLQAGLILYSLYRSMLHTIARILEYV